MFLPNPVVFQNSPLVASWHLSGSVNWSTLMTSDLLGGHPSLIIPISYWYFLSWSLLLYFSWIYTFFGKISAVVSQISSLTFSSQSGSVSVFHSPILIFNASLNFFWFSNSEVLIRSKQWAAVEIKKVYIQISINWEFPELIR